MRNALQNTLRAGLVGPKNSAPPARFYAAPMPATSTGRTCCSMAGRFRERCREGIAMEFHPGLYQSQLFAREFARQQFTVRQVDGCFEFRIFGMKVRHLPHLSPPPGAPTLVAVSEAGAVLGTKSEAGTACQHGGSKSHRGVHYRHERHGSLFRQIRRAGACQPSDGRP